MSKFALYFFVFFLSFTAYSQTVKVFISESIVERDGKQYYFHEVTQGQTVYAISKSYNVSPDEIYFENPEAKDGITVDQFLWIPTINKETELNKEVRTSNFEYFYHIAKQGDSFQKLAKHYNVPESYLLQANPNIHEPLREGEYLKIPVDDSFSETKDGAINFDPGLPVVPDYRHNVAVGETLYSISKRYKVTVNQLRSVNPGIGNKLEIGDRLRIPKPTKDAGIRIAEVEKKEQSQEPAYYNHRVQKKETLYSISRLYGVTVQDLYDANAGLTSNIDEGQIIRVPNKMIDKPYIIYTVSRKTKLNKIAKLYNIPVSKIEKENPSLSSRVLPGQKVRIPVGNKATVVDEIAIEKPTEVIDEKELVKEKAIKMGCDKIKPNYDKVSKVALMVPFYLEELDSLEVKEFMLSHQSDFLPFRFINFYEGALIAIDSLRNQGFRIDLYVYDIDQSISKAAKVLQNPELKKMDLIIGPFQNKSFDQLALFAANFNIPIVNPFSFREEVVTKYRTAIKVKSATQSQTDLLPPLVISDYNTARVFLITHTGYTNAAEVDELQQKITTVINPDYKVPNTDLHNLAVAVAYRDEEFEENDPLPVYSFEGIPIYPDQLLMMPEDSTAFYSPLIRINYMKDSLYPFFKNASPLRPNLAIIYGDSKAFVMDVMNRLNEFRDTFDIQVIAMPAFERFNNIDHIQANNMGLTYFATNYINYNSPATHEFVSNFRNRFKTDPGIYGFSGFDITYYFVESLVNLDYRLQRCIEDHPKKMLINSYELKKLPSRRNFENAYWNVLRYRNYQQIKLPDPETIKTE